MYRRGKNARKSGLLRIRDAGAIVADGKAESGIGDASSVSRMLPPGGV
ncbi:MAG: hypothetical protein ACLTSZ_02260 [Lachnospiraceae bacterium]